MKCNYIVVHHSATNPNASLEEITAAHKDRGFDDIGYHYLVTATGTVQRGRAENIQGAHALGVNSESLGVCCIGNFDEIECPEIQFSGLVGIVADLARRYGIPAERVLGHGEISAFCPEATRTRCPGTHLRKLLPALRERLSLMLYGHAFDPAVTLSSEDGQLLEIRAEFTDPLLSRLPRWGEPKDEFSHAKLTIRHCDQNNRDSAPLWSSIAPLDRCDEPSGQQPSPTRVVCMATFPQMVLSSARYTLTIEPCSATGDRTFTDTPPLFAHTFGLPITGTTTYRTPPYRAAVCAHLEQSRHTFITRLRGRAVNAGGVAWNNHSDESRPFRIGAILISTLPGSAPALELRYDFPFSVVEPGTEIPFNFTIDLHEIPPGEYLLHIGVLREKCFWMTELQGKGTEVTITVPAGLSRAGSGLSHLLNPPPIAARPSKRAPSFLYIAPTLPLFDKSGGGQRLLSLFRLLREEGVAVTFFYQQYGVFSSPEMYLAVLDELGVTHAQDPLGSLVALESPQFDLCVVGWFSYASTIFSSLRAILPNVKIVVDSIDIHWVRHLRAKEQGLSHESDEQIAAAKQEECRMYTAADEVWVVSDDDRKWLHKELPSVKTRTIGLPSTRHKRFPAHLSGTRVLFVGGFSHPPNESAALWAAEIVRTYNARYHGSLVLDLVGSDPPESILALHSDPAINVVGYAPTLDPYYDNAVVVLAPLRYGGGVKGKVCEAICRGIPVVTNAIGNEGLNLTDEVELFLAETTSEFVDVLGKVLDGRFDLDSVRRNALFAVEKRFGDTATKSCLIPAVLPPHVVIAIVSYNKRELLELCLRSIFELTSYTNYHVAVVSNGCTDGTHEMLEGLRLQHPTLLSVVYSTENEFFVRPCNLIIDSFPGSDIVLMNNDVEVTHAGWLANLVDAAYSAPNVASAGGLVLDIEGRISEAGAEIFASGYGKNLCRGLPIDSPAAHAVRYVGFVSGCLMYMRRDAIRDIGALDDLFHPMYFEDVAWHYNAHLKGWKTIYTPWCRIIHKEGSSAGQDVSKGMKRYQEINRTKFLKKFNGIALENYNEGVG